MFNKYPRLKEKQAGVIVFIYKVSLDGREVSMSFNTGKVELEETPFEQAAKLEFRQIGIDTFVTVEIARFSTHVLKQLLGSFPTANAFNFLIPDISTMEDIEEPFLKRLVKTTSSPVEIRPELLNMLPRITEILAIPSSSKLNTTRQQKQA